MKSIDFAVILASKRSRYRGIGLIDRNDRELQVAKKTADLWCHGICAYTAVAAPFYAAVPADFPATVPAGHHAAIPANKDELVGSLGASNPSISEDH